VSDIFISYARKDLEAARRLAAALEEQGWSVFWDRTIPAGKSWREVIGAALANSRCVVVLWSSHSVNSHYVIEEADHGLRRRVLIPAFIEQIEPPFGFGTIQAADLSEWREDRSSAAIQRFFGDVAGILGPAPVLSAEQRREAEAETRRKAEEQQRQQAEAEAKRAADEERQQAEAKRKADEERQQAEAKRAADEERQQAEAKRKADEERQQAEAKRKPEEEVLADLTHSVTTVARKEIGLAGAEISEKLSQAGVAAGVIVASGVLAAAALIVLLQALVITLVEVGVGPVFTSLFVGGVVAIIAFARIHKGMNDLKGEQPGAHPNHQDVIEYRRSGRP
jgi:hypothetical protein